MVRWRAFPLHPETPEDGQLLTDLFRTSPGKIEAMVTRLQATAAELGLPFGPRLKTYNSRLAQELGVFAESRGKGDVFHLFAFRAYFGDGLNLADHSVLLKICREIGLPEDNAREVLATRTYKEQVDLDWLESRQRNITAVPTFAIGQDRLVGAQSYEALVDLVCQYGAQKSTLQVNEHKEN